MAFEWKVVTPEVSKGRKAPFVSIGRGKLDFNAAACDLVGDDGSYTHAQILEAKDGNKTIVGVRFFKEFQPGCIAVTRKKMADGRLIAGLSIAQKGTIERLFGKDGRNEGTIRKSVRLDPDDNVLIIED